MADPKKWDSLDDFEKSLAAEKVQRERDEERRERRHKHRSHRDGDDDHDHGRRRHRHGDKDRDRDRSRDRSRDRKRERDSDRHSHRHRRDGGDGDDEHRHKRVHRHDDRESRRRHDKDRHSQHRSRHERQEKPISNPEEMSIDDTKQQPLERDSWMTAPSALDLDYIHRKKDKSPPPKPTTAPQRIVHAKELNIHLNDEQYISSKLTTPGTRTIDYTFGDSGSSWRMKKLRAVFATAEESGLPVEDVALKQYGSLEVFDDAREEKEEMERRAVYGEGYEMKEKPSGELHRDRLRNTRKGDDDDDDNVVSLEHMEQGVIIPEEPKQTMDQTALNRLRAQMMKAKLKRAPNAAHLEAQYNLAAASFTPSTTTNPPSAIVLNPMESRHLTGPRSEVLPLTTKRGLQRGTLQENNDMSISDMIREERRTRTDPGGEALRQAERIAKDVKYTNDLEYMDDNAAKLAQRVHKNEASLKSSAIHNLQKLTRILDSCPLCHHEDTNTPPIAPVLSLGTRCFLTLPTEPEVSLPGGAVIVPLSHRRNLLECDDDEWEEIRNFMKSLTRLYHAQGRDVLFYENAAHPASHRHAAMVAAPIPYEEGGMAPQYFREAFLSSDAEWSQHRPVIDTQKVAEEGGMGRAAFRRSLAKEMPYFHVWFTLDGGLGHVVEDGRWPKGDLFAREVIGGIVGTEMHVVKKQGRWKRGGGGDGRVEGWKKEWRKYDWTRVLREE